jgi:hypothetical protein
MCAAGTLVELGKLSGPSAWEHWSIWLRVSVPAIGGAGRPLVPA